MQRQDAWQSRGERERGERERDERERDERERGERAPRWRTARDADDWWNAAPGAPSTDRENVSGGPRYEQSRRQPGYARAGAFDSRSARGGLGGAGPSPYAREEGYGSDRYGQLPGAAGPWRGEHQRAAQFGGPSHDDEAWLQDQGFPKLGQGIEARTAQVEHGPYAGGTQQGGPSFESGSPTTTGTYAGRGPRGYRRSDARILDDVADRLTEHDEIDASDIEVEVRDGEVYLQGTVHDRRMRRLAEEIAEDVRGVLDVVNRLQVARPSEPGHAERRPGERDDAWSRQGDPGPSALGHTYQGTGMGTGGMDVSYRGAATAGAARTGGPIGTAAPPRATTPSGPPSRSERR